MSPEEMAARDSAMLEAVAASEAVDPPGQEKKGGLFGKLFKRNRSEAAPPASIPEPAPQADLPSEMVETPVTNGESANAPIPDPEPFETAAAAPSAPAPEPTTAPVADIFSRRASAESATSSTATVASDSQVEVGGVLVTLYEGTAVGVISQDGGTTKIRLQDQRVGTIKSSELR